MIEFLEPLWIEEGRELVVTIEEEMIPAALQRFEQAAGSWAGLIAEEEFLNDIYKARMLPRIEVKHNLILLTNNEEHFKRISGLKIESL